MWDIHNVEPPRRLPNIILNFLFFVILVISLIFQHVIFPTLNIDSAKVAITIQIPITIAVLALFVAVLIFNRRIVIEQNEKLREAANTFLKKIEGNYIDTPNEHKKTIDVIYNQFLNLVKRKRQTKTDNKEAFESLGNLWVLRELSNLYEPRGSKKLLPFLKSNQTKELDEINKVCVDSMLDTWDNYHRNIAKFVLSTIQTFNYVYKTFEENKVKSNIEIEESTWESFKLLPEIVSELVKNSSKIIAERVMLHKSSSQITDIATIGILGLAIVLGIVSILCLNTQSLEYFQKYVPSALKYLTFVPIGLSIYGLYLTLLKIIFSLSR